MKRSLGAGDRRGGRGLVHTVRINASSIFLVALGVLLGVHPALAAESNGAADVDPEELKDLSLVALMDLSEEVWAATRTKTTIYDAPAVVTVLTRQDLLARGYRSLADALRFVNGFNVVDDHIFPSAGVRGVASGLFNESGNIKVMIDGHSVAIRTTASNAIGPELIPLSAVERIEIVRGPVSPLYGADAFLGVVNIVTRDPTTRDDVDIYATGSFVNDRHLGYDIDLSATSALGPVSFLLGGRLVMENRSGMLLPETSPELDASPSLRADRRIRGLVQNSASLVARLVYEIDGDTLIEAFGNLSAIERGGDLSFWAHLSHGLDADGRPTGTNLSLASGQAGLRFSSSLWDGAHFELRSFYFQGGPTAGDRIDVGSASVWVRRNFGYQGNESIAELTWQITPKITMVGGLEGTYDRELRPSGVRVLREETLGQPAGTELDPPAQEYIDFLNGGVFLQATWQALEAWLTITGGVRLDYHSVYGLQPSARVGLVSNLAEGLYVKLLYGSAFKAPSPYLLYAEPLRAGGVVGNAQLAPQYVHAVEARVDYQPFSWLRIGTGVSANFLLNKAEFVQQGFNQIAQNQAEMLATVWESEVQASWNSWLAAHFMSEYNVVERRSAAEGYLTQLAFSGNPIYPEWTFRFGLRDGGGLPIPLRYSVEAAVVGPRTSSDSNSLQAARAYQLSPYVYLNAVIGTAPLQLDRLGSVVFELMGTNLLGEVGPAAGTSGIDYPLPPRTVMARLRYSL